MSVPSPRCAVVGKTVADQLFPNTDPVGQTLRIRNIPFKILGVLDPARASTSSAQDQDDVVIVPYTSHIEAPLPPAQPQFNPDPGFQRR